MKQVSLVREKLALLRLIHQQIKKGKEYDVLERHSIMDDIVPRVTDMAEQLGMHAEQKELQDRCIQLAYPEDYAKLKKLLLDSEAMCENVFKTFALPIRAMLDDAEIEYDFQYRMKSIYSIWRKMRVDHKEFDDVYDLFATRIVYKVPEKLELKEDVDTEKLICYRIYNIIAMLYRIHPDRIKDWVRTPKPSGYQALQFTVMGPDCNWIEIQIRSERMDYEAEYGSAAHWKYKQETENLVNA